MIFAEVDAVPFNTAFFQAGATLVAIVAGVLGARFVAAHGEVQALRDRCARLDQAEKTSERRFRKASRTLLRKRAERRVSSEQFLEEYVLTQEALLVEQKADSMDPRIRDFFRVGVERVDDYLTRCTALVDQWGNRPLSAGTLKMDGAPTAATQDASVFAHYVLEKAREQRGMSADHERKFLNLALEVKRRDERRHRKLQSEIEQASDRAPQLAAELDSVQRQASEARKELDMLQAGEGFRLGLRTLGIVAILSMGPPVGLLLLRPDGWQAWPEVGVAALFAVGIAVVLRYLYVYSAFLTGDSALPTAAWRLVWPRPRQPEGRSRT